MLRCLRHSIPEGERCSCVGLQKVGRSARTIPPGESCTLALALLASFIRIPGFVDSVDLVTRMPVFVKVQSRQPRNFLPQEWSP